MTASLIGSLLPPFSPPAQAAALVLLPTCTTAGGSVSASGSGAPPGLYVTFHMPQAMGWSSLQVPVGATRSDMMGSFGGRFSLPSGLAPGSYTVEARWAQGMGSGLLGTATVTVVAQAASCPQDPSTGDPSTASYLGPVLGVFMVSPNNGWAVGNPNASSKNKFWHYDGAAWSVHPQEFDAGLYSIFMLSATEGWAGGYYAGNLVFYRYDGQSWSLFQTLAAGTYESQVKAIRMTSSSDGWAVTSEAFYHFDGNQWSPAFSRGAQDISMVSSQDGWALSAGSLYRYKAGQWAVSEFGDPLLQSATLYAIYMVSATDGWLAGTASAGPGFMAHWDGSDWKVTLSSYGLSCPGAVFDVRSIFMASSKVGLAVGRNCMFGYDTNRSSGWQAVSTPAPYNQFSGQLRNLTLRSVFLTSPTQGWIVGEEDWGTSPAGGFYRYTGASLTLNPTSGPPGTPVIAKGTGFSPDSQVGLSWGGSLALAKVWPQTDGSFTSTVVVPGEVLSGTYNLVAENVLAGADGNARSAEAAFKVTSLPQNTTVYSIEAPASAYARLAGSYGSAPPGEIDGQYILKVRVSRVQPLPWQPASGVGVTFNLLESPSGVSLSANSATTDSPGWASTTVNLGQAEGTTILSVASGTASQNVLIQAFRQPAPPSGLPPGFVPGAITGGLSAPPVIKLKPSSGPPGTQVEVQGSGFQSSFVDLYFDGQTRLGGTYAFAGSLGATLKVEVPLGAAVGDHTVTAINKAGDYASATFTVGSPASLLPTPTPTTPPVGCAAVDPCATPTATPTPNPAVDGTVTGVVYDRATGKPVSSKYGTSLRPAKVEWSVVKEVYTDEEGRYSISLPQGLRFLRAVNDWYKDLWDKAGGEPVAVSAGKTTVQDFYLDRKQGVIQGKVRLEDPVFGNVMRGLEGIGMKFVNYYTSGTYQAYTDQDGAYTVCVPVGTYRMQIEMNQQAAIYGLLGQILKTQHEIDVGVLQSIGKSLEARAGARSPAEAASCAVGGGATVQHDVTFLGALAAPAAQPGQKYQVQGTVKDSVTGEALSGVDIMAWKVKGLHGCSGPQELIQVGSARTDTSGKYILSLEEPGAYQLAPSFPDLMSGLPQCIDVEAFNVSGVDFAATAPSFLTTSCPVSGQDRRLQSFSLKEFLDYVRAVLSKAVPGSEFPDAVEAGVEVYKTTMNQVMAYNTAVVTALVNDDLNNPAITIRVDSLLIDDAWAAHQKPGVLNRLLVDLGPYWRKLKTAADADLTMVDRKAIVGILSGYYKQFPQGTSKCTGPRLQVQGHSPFTLLLVDEEGRQTGVDPTTQVLTNTIPGASYTGPLTRTQVLEVPYPSGRYWVQATGTGAGQWAIDVVGLLGQKAVASSTLTGTIQTGATFLASASVAASGLEPTIQVSVPATMARKVHLPFLAKAAQGW